MIWYFLAGLGIFLFGMWLMEDSLKKLAGRTFKLFLKKHTKNKAEAILSGVLVTAVLQSSSVVSLMVLAFVGAGVMHMRNGLAVVLGSNLGTTLSSWVVVLIGFELNIELISLPIIAISAIGFVLFQQRTNFKNVFLFGIGFGFLFFGLDYMKESIESLVLNFDFSGYSGYDRFFFILVGLIITALIQSSSVTMVITLSALNAGAIPFAAAVAIIIGSELGTSLKTMIGSIGSIPAKKRVAMGNIIFNTVILIISVVFMGTMIRLVHLVTGGENELIALVLFQTLMNLIGLILFYPFLQSFGDFLEKYFINGEQHSAIYISKVSPLVPGAAMDAVEKEVNLFLLRVSFLNMDAFHITGPVLSHPSFDEFRRKHFPEKNEYMVNYEKNKEAEGEILTFCSKMRKENMDEEDVKRMDALISAVRNAMYSAKSMKDVLHNRISFHNSANDIKYGQYKLYQEQLSKFYKEVNRILSIQDKSVCFGELVQLTEQSRNDYEFSLGKIYDHTEVGHFSEMDISTLLNVNRELFSSRKAMIQALKFILLEEKQAMDFDSLPLRLN